MIDRMIDLTKHHSPLRNSSPLAWRRSIRNSNSAPARDQLLLLSIERLGGLKRNGTASLFGSVTKHRQALDGWQMALCHQKDVYAVFIDLTRSLLCRGRASGCQFVSRRSVLILPRRGHDEVLSKSWSANEFALARDKLLAHAIHRPWSIGVPGWAFARSHL